MGNVTDFSAFIDTLQSRRLFERGTKLVVARAPGRLDVMGGIADYSGSLVLQRTSLKRRLLRFKSSTSR
jgi:hypothetical protein